MEPWYKVVEPRKEVREGRSFNPDEFAIALEQVVAGSAPPDYADPEEFFRRTYFTGALKEHALEVLRRLAGETTKTAPVLTLVTQFGGGKTHTLTALYHLATSGEAARKFDGVHDLVWDSGLREIPKAQVAVFVGNAWDPQPGKETPWIDLARQIGGDQAVKELGSAAKDTPPGTEALGRIFRLAGKPVLILCDEVLNFANRHRELADKFHAFIQNLTVACAGHPNVSAVISLPRSQVEMTEHDLQWQEKIKKVVNRVAKDLIANDETEISKVVCRRLFESTGDPAKVRAVACEYAEWAFQNRHHLPAEWTAVDSATDTSAREHLKKRFADSYPFHPTTLTVFQRKWAPLPQYQQTRGTLAMLAQWVGLAMKDGFIRGLKEPLITIGSAPLQDGAFRATVLSQLGEQRLNTAIDTDISGDIAISKGLDADAPEALKHLHRKVAATIFFESSGGQVQRQKVAHLPELCFAVGGPGMETTSIANAAHQLESRCYFIRKVGQDGYEFSHRPTLKKIVSDRRAGLDSETEVIPQMEALVKEEFEKGKVLPVHPFPKDGSEVGSTIRLTLIVLDPRTTWEDNGDLRKNLAQWTTHQGSSPRLYPGALLWCVKKQGNDLKQKVEDWLAWKRVKKEADEGLLGPDLEDSDRQDAEVKLKAAQRDARDEVWASYRYLVLYDPQADDNLRVIDIGAGHASAGLSLTGRIVEALKTNSLVNEAIGHGYLIRNWPPSLKEQGVWPLEGLRQSFLNGTLTRLIDPDTVLRSKIPEFVANKELGLGSGLRSDGTFERYWFGGLVSSDDVAFEKGVYLLTREKAEQLHSPEPISTQPPEPLQEGTTAPGQAPGQAPTAEPEPAPVGPRTLRIKGSFPPELWNKVGIKLIPKLKDQGNVQVVVKLEASLADSSLATSKEELLLLLQELDVSDTMSVDLE